MLSIDALRALPKIELHAHLETSMCVDTALTLHNQYCDVPLTLAAWQVQNRIHKKSDFFHCWQIVQSSLRSVEDYAIAAHSALRAQRADGIIYNEMLLSVSAIVEKGLELSDVFRALEQVARSYPEIQMKIIADLTRDYGEQHAMHTVEKLNGIASSLLVGIGLGGSEHQFSTKNFKRVFALARSYGFQCTAHAGELAGAERIAEACDDLHVRRIGHALHITEQPRLFEILRERNICVEACPGSNLCLALIDDRAAYPLRALLDAAVPVCLNSDDPLLCGTRLSDELFLNAQACQLQFADIQQLQRHALDAAFIDHHERARLAQQLDWLN